MKQITILTLLLFSLLGCLQEKRTKLMEETITKEQYSSISDSVKTYDYNPRYGIKFTSYNFSKNEFQDQKNDNMQTVTNPIYELYIDARGCYFEMLVNDIPVYYHYSLGAITLRLPINSFISESGEQNISFKMLPVVESENLHKDAEIKLTIDTYPKDNPQNRTTIFEFNTPCFQNIDLPTYFRNSKFNAEVPYKLTNWKNGVDLKKLKKSYLREEIEKIYTEYTLAIQHNDSKKYLELNNLKFENTLKSLYQTPEEVTSFKENSLNGIDYNKVKLYPLDKYKLVLHGNGKLVGLQKLGEAPGIYIDTTDSLDNGFMEYMLFFKKNKNSPLSIIF